MKDESDDDYIQLSERYESLRRLPNETSKTWRKRCCYCVAGSKRSFGYVVENEMKIPKTHKDYKKAVNSVSKLATKWGFDMYAHLYDVEEQTFKLQKRQEKFDELEDVELVMVEAIIKSLNNFIAEFIRNPVKKDGEEYSLVTKVDLYNKILSAFDKADVILRRLTGQPLEYTKIDNNSVIDVKATVSDVKSLKDEEAEAEEYFKQLESEMSNDYIKD